MEHIASKDCSCMPEVLFVGKEGIVYIHHDINKPPIEVVAEAIELVGDSVNAQREYPEFS